VITNQEANRADCPISWAIRRRATALYGKRSHLPRKHPAGRLLRVGTGPQRLDALPMARRSPRWRAAAISAAPRLLAQLGFAASPCIRCLNPLARITAGQRRPRPRCSRKRGSGRLRWASRPNTGAPTQRQADLGLEKASTTPRLLMSLRASDRWQRARQPMDNSNTQIGNDPTRSRGSAAAGSLEPHRPQRAVTRPVGIRSARRSAASGHPHTASSDTHQRQRPRPHHIRKPRMPSTQGGIC